MSTVIDNEAPMSIAIRTSSDYQTLSMLDSVREYIKNSGLRENMIGTCINQILIDAGCKTLSQERIKELLAVAPDSHVIKGDEPLKNVNQALSK